MIKVFIDGGAGTTGLRIADRLSCRNDIELVALPEELRKDTDIRCQAINNADIVFLCLPDDAARQAVSLVTNPNTVIIDTSTAHRTEDGWVYGFPELDASFESRIKTSKRISVPGCHASGYIALIKPLIDSNILSKDIKLSCHSVTGYSGGGKKMIEQYEAIGRSILLDSPRIYGLSCQHKHLKEMQIITNMNYAPIFTPIVADFYSGMLVTVPIFASNIALADKIKRIYKDKYNSRIVSYVEEVDEEGFLAANALSNSDRMEISVFGNEDRILLCARYDNLGKGASGAAIECMNIVMGVSKTEGLSF